VSGILLGLLVLALATAVALFVWVRAGRYRDSRAEAVRRGGEVRRAEHQLYNLAGSAFMAMLDATRGKPTSGCQYHR